MALALALAQTQAQAQAKAKRRIYRHELKNMDIGYHSDVSRVELKRRKFELCSSG